MKKFINKCLLCLCACCCAWVGGCSSQETKEEEENVALIANAVYEAPSNPTREQILVYNELSEALNHNAQDDKVAQLVAVNFAYEFLSLYQKSGKEDIGGLTFLPEDEREAFRSYALIHYYNNYQAVLSQYGEEDLPNVILHEVSYCEPQQIYYGQLYYDGYIVGLTLKYADSKLPADGLKTTMEVQVINNNGVYQVIALEDRKD